VAVRAVIVQDGRLLIVNAYPGDSSDLWCAPGGGVEKGASMPDNLQREVFEETGLAIRVGEPCLVSEFNQKSSGFHQVDVFFHARVIGRARGEGWVDTEGVVNRHRWVTESELRLVRFKPDSLLQIAFGRAEGVLYDPLEELVG